MILREKDVIDKGMLNYKKHHLPYSFLHGPLVDLVEILLQPLSIFMCPYLGTYFCVICKQPA